MSISSKRFCWQAVLVSVLLSVFFALGCSNQEEVVSPVKDVEQTLWIGLIPEQNIFSQLNRYEPLAVYLSGKIGMKIKLKSLSRYGNIIDNFTAAGLDGAFFGSFTAVLAFKKLNVEVLARPEFTDGTSTYYGMVFVRKDSNINNAADMKGKIFAFVDKATTAGWLLPMRYFKTLGIDDYRTWFKESYFAGTHEDAIYDVLKKRADIGCAKNTVFYRLAAADPTISENLKILTTSPEVPANALAVRRDLESAVKAKLKEALLDMDKDEQGRIVLRQFGATRFIETTQGDYQPVFDYVKEINLDLATYDYLNE